MKENYLEEGFITTTLPLGGKVKQRYNDFVVEEVTDEGICEVKRYNRPLTERNFEKIKIPENPEQKENLILEMEKINTDTITALSTIARGINTSKKRMGYAGLKDKRAVTCQRISIFEPDLTKMENFGVKGIELRNPRWGNRIELGDLHGNQFTIIIRNLKKTPQEIEKVVQEFALQLDSGVPNYFGTQRFGGKRNVTHKVGKLLLQQKFEEAVMLYLTETYSEEKTDLKNARINLAKTKDFAKALKEFPHDARTELAMLNHLVKNPNDYSNVFAALPKKIRYLFTHAYQSHLFNKMITARIKLLGKKALTPQKYDTLEEGYPTAMLPGYESTFSEGFQGEIEKKVLGEEGITFEEFKVNGLAEISSQGMRKQIVLKPQNFRIVEITKDEFNEEANCVKLSFYLTKGNYATTLLRELLKEEIY